MFPRFSLETLGSVLVFQIVSSLFTPGALHKLTNENEAKVDVKIGGVVRNCEILMHGECCYLGRDLSMLVVQLIGVLSF